MIKYEESGRARRVSTQDLSFAAFILRLYVALWVLVISRYDAEFGSTGFKWKVLSYDALRGAFTSIHTYLLYFFPFYRKYARWKGRA